MKRVDPQDGGAALVDVPGQVRDESGRVVPLNGHRRAAAAPAPIDWHAAAIAVAALDEELEARVADMRTKHRPLVAAMHVEPLRARLLSVEDVRRLIAAKLEPDGPGGRAA